MSKNHKKNLSIIGANAFVEIEGIKKIPAKIDTGADSSSVHAENISVSKDGLLSFELFGKKFERAEFRATTVRSSNGDEEVRYRVPLSLKLNDRKIRAFFTLTNREKNNFPVLIGRKTIKDRFIVDVSNRPIRPKLHPKTKHLNELLRKNPFKFHKKYIESIEEKD